MCKWKYIMIGALRLLLIFTIALSNSVYAESSDDFWKKAGKAITSALGYDKSYFKLYRRPGKNAPFYIYSKEPGTIQNIICKSNAYYDIGSTQTSNIVGWINVGICQNDSLITGDVLNNQKQYMSALIDHLGGKPNINNAFTYEQYKLGNDLQTDIYPVIAIGHGVGIVQTAFTATSYRDKVVFVQYYGQNLCTSLPNLILCSDHTSALKELSSLLYYD